MAQPLRKPVWGNIDVFGLINGLATWDEQYTSLAYVRKPYETNLDIRNKIHRYNDNPADITKQGVINAINNEFDLDPYNATKKSIFELTFNPIPSGDITVQDVSGFYKTSSGTWNSIGSQVWSQDYESARQNKVGFIVWQQNRIANVSGIKNFSYSNIVEVFNEFADETQLRFEYYVNVFDADNNRTLVRFTDMNNQQDIDDIRFTYRIEKQDLTLSGSALVYNFNDIPSNLESLYFDENGYPTLLLYDIRRYIDSKFKHTWKIL